MARILRQAPLDGGSHWLQHPLQLQCCQSWYFPCLSLFCGSWNSQKVGSWWQRSLFYWLATGVRWCGAGCSKYSHRLTAPTRVLRSAWLHILRAEEQEGWYTPLPTPYPSISWCLQQIICFWGSAWPCFCLWLIFSFWNCMTPVHCFRKVQVWPPFSQHRLHVIWAPLPSDTELLKLRASLTWKNVEPLLVRINLSLAGSL